MALHHYFPKGVAIRGKGGGGRRVSDFLRKHFKSGLEFNGLVESH